MCWHFVSSSPGTLNMLLICQSRLKSAIIFTSVIQSESGAVTPAWWRRTFIMLCSGLYHPAGVDGVQHVLSSWGITITPQLSFPIYISMTCRTSQSCADECRSTHCPIQISALYMCISWQMLIALTNTNGAKPVVRPSHQACFPSCARTSAKPGDISASSDQSLVIAGKRDTAKESAGVYDVVYPTHVLPMANHNNKTFVEKTKNLKDRRGREERPMHIATALKGSVRGENSWMISSCYHQEWSFWEWCNEELLRKMLSKQFLLEMLFWHIRPYCFDHSLFKSNF